MVFQCEPCKYFTPHLSKYEEHLKTRKHMCNTDEQFKKKIQEEAQQKKAQRLRNIKPKRVTCPKCLKNMVKQQYEQYHINSKICNNRVKRMNLAIEYYDELKTMQDVLDKYEGKILQAPFAKIEKELFLKSLAEK